MKICEVYFGEVYFGVPFRFAVNCPCVKIKSYDQLIELVKDLDQRPITMGFLSASMFVLV